jgi:hypothetical protein
MTGTTTSGTSDSIIDELRAGSLDPERWVTMTQVAAEMIEKLRHDLANAECAASLMGEVYDRMVLKYEAQLTALRESVEKMAERHT